MAQTIDITSIVEMMQSSFVQYMVIYLYGIAIATPGLQWLALPIISDIFKYFVGHFVKKVADSAVMIAFFQETAIRKTSDAQNYAEAMKKLENIPDDITREEYAKLEQAAMAAFKSLVMVK